MQTDASPAAAREFQAAVNAILRRFEAGAIDARDAAFYVAAGYYTPERAAFEIMDVDPTNR